MSERFTRLFSQQPNLYAATSPVVVAAGALLKDNQSGKVLVQLKLRSIGAKEIKAVKVTVYPFDTAGAPLGAEVEHQYLDLTAKRGEEFGAKTPILLPDATSRAFSVIVTEVIFADNSIWKATGALWEALPRPALLSDTLGDEELLRQYHMTYGAACKYVPTAHRDLWYCTCGALNRQGETCHACRRALPDLQRIDLAALRAERDARLAAEKAAAEEKARADAAAAEEKARADAAAAEARAKKAKKLAMIVTPLLALAVAAYFLITLVVIPNAKYNAAVELMDAGQYEEAIAAFEAMDGYKDSAERSLELWDEFAERKTVDAGDSHTVGLRPDGTVVAVGYNRYGQCDVSGWTDIVAVSAENYHTVGLKSDDTVVAVGSNRYGQCDVSGWTDIVAVSAGNYHTVGLKSDGTVVAVGNNSYGQCDVSSWTDIAAVAAGELHTVGLKSGGTVVAVGTNSLGQCDVSGWTDIKLPK